MYDRIENKQIYSKDKLKMTKNSNNNQNFIKIPNTILSIPFDEMNSDSLKLVILLGSAPENQLFRNDCMQILDLTSHKMDTAVGFLVCNNILTVDKGKNLKLIFSDTQVQEIMPKIDIKKTADEPEPISHPVYSNSEITKIAKNNREIKFVFDQAECALNKALSPHERESLYLLYDFYKLPCEVISMVLHYCAMRNQRGIAYITKTAINWATEGINTIELAEAYLKTKEDKSRIEREVSYIFGISGRALTSKEKDYVNKWMDTFNFDKEMIQYAYETCVDSIGKMSFAYINSIMQGLFENNITTVEQAKLFQQNHKNGNKAKYQRKAEHDEKKQSYDIDEFAQLARKRKLTTRPKSE